MSSGNKARSTSPKRLFVRSFVVLMLLGVDDAWSADAASKSPSNQGSVVGPAGGADPAGQPRFDPATMTKLLAKSQDAPVRVIVEFAIGRVSGQQHRAEALLTAAQATAQQPAIQGATDHGHVKTYRTLPLVALEAGPETLNRLASDLDVVGIQEDVPTPPNLAESLPLIGADVAWSEGYGGTGWAIAILDTGVDRNHRFLRDKIVSEAPATRQPEAAPSHSARAA